MKDKSKRKTMSTFSATPGRWFASDNHASVHPLILEAIKKANQGHSYAYGADPWTAKAQKDFKKLFGAKSESFFVFNGTAANVLSLQTFLRPFEAAICAEGAHLSVDECGAFEAISGSKLIVIPSLDGKLNLDKAGDFLMKRGDQHHVQPRVITITQTTEWGTVYSRDELREIKNFKNKNKLFLHMDGARFANACAALQIEAREMMELAGVDVLSFGGTKNGCLMGEAVVFRNSQMSENFKYIRKQGMQLSSKMRFISAQLSAYLKDDLWIKNATHANKMAQILQTHLKNIPHVEFVQKTQANALFVKIPKTLNKKLLNAYYFYIWDSEQNILRIMTSWDTQPEEIKNFASLF